MDCLRHARLIAFTLGLGVMLAGCSPPRDAWPPAPHDQHERQLIEAALRAVEQNDGWDQVACVVERHEGRWRVQAWQIVHPEKKGRSRCVPWAVRGVIFDNDANLVAYRNFL